jgi:putative membrane protein
VDYIFLYIKGLCIGATGVMQGISGGSMAWLLGIYEEFIFSLRGIDRQAWKMLREKQLSALWRKINGTFLALLCAGVISGLLVLRSVFNYYYGKFPIYVSSFFFTLVIIAALLLLRKIKRWNAVVVVAAVLGLALSYWITRSAPVQMPDNLFFSFLAGILGGSTFIVPGVSGAFILIFFGKYQFILTSFDSLEGDIITFFVAGGILGIIVFARLTAAMLAQHFNATVAFFAGLMIGSLNKIWPWRQVLEYATTTQGKRIPSFDKSILPWQYLEVTGKDPQMFNAILMMALGVFIVVVIEKITARLKTKS